MADAIIWGKNNGSMSMRISVLKFGVDRKSLYKRMKEELPLVTGLERHPFLSDLEEKKLVQHCVEMADL